MEWQNVDSAPIDELILVSDVRGDISLCKKTCSNKYYVFSGGRPIYDGDCMENLLTVSCPHRWASIGKPEVKTDK